LALPALDAKHTPGSAHHEPFDPSMMMGGGWTAFPPGNSMSPQSGKNSLLAYYFIQRALLKADYYSNITGKIHSCKKRSKN
jgi:hypothetical protein